MIGAAGAHPFPADRSVIRLLRSTLLRTANFFRKPGFETDILSGEKNWNVRLERMGTGCPNDCPTPNLQNPPSFALHHV